MMETSAGLFNYTARYMSNPRRICLHWTAGAKRASEHDKHFYNHLIDFDGTRHDGLYPDAAQCYDTFTMGYAAHVAGANGYTIGISMAGMWDAKPGKLGTAQLTAAQWHSCVDLNAELCIKYGIVPSTKTIVGHCEVKELWGIDQGGKWDPFAPMKEWTWTHGLTPRQIGDMFRQSVIRRMVAMGTIGDPKAS